MRSFFVLWTCFAAGALLPASAAAQSNVVTPAREYARGSTSLFVSAVIGNVTASNSFSTASAFSMALAGSVRWTLSSGVAVEPRLSFLVGGGSGGSAVLIGPGLGLGYAIPIGDSAAFTPMLTYSALVLASGGGGVQHTVGVEAPFTVMIGSHGIIEPYLFLRVTPYEGVTATAYGLGLRLGVRL